MKMDKINELIKEHGWSLLSWRERYGGEVWIAIAPTRNHVDILEDMNTDGDAESLTLTDYLFEQGSWLPAVRDQTFTTALNRLEAKVNTVPQDLFDLWKDAVWGAYQEVLELSLRGIFALRHAVEQSEPALMVPEKIREYF